MHKAVCSAMPGARYGILLSTLGVFLLDGVYLCPHPRTGLNSEGGWFISAQEGCYPGDESQPFSHGGGQVSGVGAQEDRHSGV